MMKSYRLGCKWVTHRDQALPQVEEGCPGVPHDQALPQVEEGCPGAPHDQALQRVEEGCPGAPHDQALQRVEEGCPDAPRGQILRPQLVGEMDPGAFLLPASMKFPWIMLVQRSKTRALGAKLKKQRKQRSAKRRREV